MPAIEHVRRALAAHEPRVLAADAGALQAAVALLLRERTPASGLEVLLIERAQRRGDPWSGHMAFPGGRLEPDDPHLQRTAERETWEEVGISLDATPPVGRLDDMQGRAGGRSGMVISAFVYHLVDPPDPVLNHEVQDAFWFPLRDLRDPRRQLDDYLEQRLPGRPFRAIQLDRRKRVVWGLTYRFLEHFFDLLGKPLRGRS